MSKNSDRKKTCFDHVSYVVPLWVLIEKSVNLKRTFIVSYVYCDGIIFYQKKLFLA